VHLSSALLRLATALLLAAPAAGEEALVRGRVVDPAGGAIAGAEVRALAGDLPGGSSLADARTGADGSFAFAPGAARAGRLVVQAPGFSEREAPWRVDAELPLVVVLEPARAEEVTVTAGRTEARLADTPARVVVLDREALTATPALTLDDALRQVPGFSLFRRSGSRVANPTAQGASLRGMGPSGASRTVVLLDGIPLNDPFGGWVYWSRVPRAALDRLEVVEGGASELYGSAALGGVVQALSRTDAPAITAEASGGNEGTGALSVFAAGRRGGWGARLAGEAFTTDGYVLVSDEVRGSVDTPAGARHLSGILTVDRRLSSRSSVFLQATRFGESRDNGTPLQVNDTDLWELRGGADAALLSGALAVRGWYSSQTYDQDFSAVTADRQSETLTRRQRVPSTAGGGSLTWSRTFASGHGLVAGIEGRRVEGSSDETVFVQARPTTELSAGGVQATFALYAEGRLALGTRTLLAGGARLDRWSETDGFSRSRPISGGAGTATSYEDRSATAISPRLSLLFRATPHLRLFAAAYGAFRGPTLNELYRSFRVGDTLTLANPALQEERLGGGEAGLAWASRDERLRVRATGFLARLEDPVANITLVTTPTLVTRQRQNLGRTRSLGLELDAEWRVGGHLFTGVGYAWTWATVRSFPADPTLEGNDVPQVPRHQATLQARYANPALLEAALLARASSLQYDDDQNLLPLGGYLTLDLRVARRFGRRVEAFAALENLTGDRYDVGRTPVLTLGPPRLARAGLRLDWGGATR
jgi:outer membrane receptor protein involved in Fe transport